MLTETPAAYARLPTFTEVIDGLADGLGIATNQDDALGSLALYGRRIKAYSGWGLRPGVERKVLKLLAGSNKTLRRLVRTRLLEAETALTNARAIPLVTEATEAEGKRRFIEIWAVSWIAQILTDARQHPESVLDSIRLLLEAHVAKLTSADQSYLSTWKAAIKKAIPEDANATDFRLKIDKLDQRSQRKLSSIEEDIAELRDDMGVAFYAAAEAVRRIYIAGMVTMRLCAKASEIIPERNLLALVADNLREGLNKFGYASKQAQDIRILRYWEYFDPAFKMTNVFNQLSQPARHQNDQTFDKLRADSRAVDPAGLLIPAIDFKEGYWHLCHGRNDQAECYLQKVVEYAHYRQLGVIASYAASLLIALQLIKSEGASGALKFESLNRLMRVRIDNMVQSLRECPDFTTTPFSDRPRRPKISVYDSHLIACVAYFNTLMESSICNPLQRFDACLEKLIARSRQPGAKLAERERRRPAIVGTSVKPYQMLRNWLYYRLAPFEFRQPNLPGIDAYLRLSQSDQLRLLRFIDPEEFKKDLKKHGLGSWRHPDDPP